jgi:hypothetical protein
LIVTNSSLEAVTVTSVMTDLGREMKDRATGEMAGGAETEVKVKPSQAIRTFYVEAKIGSKGDMSEIDSRLGTGDKGGSSQPFLASGSSNSNVHQYDPVFGIQTAVSLSVLLFVIGGYMLARTLCRRPLLARHRSRLPGNFPAKCFRGDFLSVYTATEARSFASLPVFRCPPALCLSPTATAAAAAAASTAQSVECSEMEDSWPDGRRRVQRPSSRRKATALWVTTQQFHTDHNQQHFRRYRQREKMREQQYRNNRRHNHRPSAPIDFYEQRQVFDAVASVNALPCNGTMLRDGHMSITSFSVYFSSTPTLFLHSVDTGIAASSILSSPRVLLRDRMNMINSSSTTLNDLLNNNIR